MARLDTDPPDWVDTRRFDYLILGSGLCESMIAHSLVSSHPSSTVLQVDPNPFYGQSWAAVQLDQLESTVLPSSSSSIHLPPTTHPPINKSSSYAISLQPTLVPARGRFVNTLVSSNVAPYLSFQLLHAFILAQPDRTLLSLPGSKHDLFRTQELSLIEKRLLMRFLQSILEPDGLVIPEPLQSLSDYLSRPPYSISNTKLHSVIAALSLAPSSDPPAQSVIARLRTLLSSIGRYPSPTVSALPAALLLGEYGGGGEWVEGFVRAAAVTGRAIHVIGRPILSLERSPDDQERWKVRLGPQTGHPCGGEDQLEFTAGRLLISQEYLPLLVPDLKPPKLYTILRSITIVGRPGLDRLSEICNRGLTDQRSRHALFVFPSEADDDRPSPVHGLVVGPESGSCPEGEQIVYLSCILPTDRSIEDPSSVLKPSLDRLLNSCSSNPSGLIRFIKSYSQPIYRLPDPTRIPSGVLVIPTWPNDLERSSLAEVVEWIVEAAEDLSKLATL